MKHDGAADGSSGAPVDAEAARLTALALGELEGPEADALRARATDDAAMAAELSAIESLAAELETAFAAEPGAGLDAERRAAVAAGPDGADGAGEADGVAHADTGPQPSIVVESTAVRRSVLGRIGPFILGGAAIAAVAGFAILPMVGEPAPEEETFAIGDSFPGMPPDSSATLEATGRFGVAGGIASDEGVVSEHLLSDTDGVPASSSPERARRSRAMTRGDAANPAGSLLAPGVAPPPVLDALVITPTPTPATASTPPVRVRREPVGSTPLSDVVVRYAAPVDASTRRGVVAEGRVGMSEVLDLPADLREAHLRQPSGFVERRQLTDREWVIAAEAPLSTFSIDVDTASYANVRRFLEADQMPPADMVRVEELINRFSYDYPQPEGEHPISVTTEFGVSPWTPEHRIVRIGLQGWELPTEERPAANLVFLVDVSGSMNAQNKLPLLQASLRMMVEALQPSDRVAMAVYAGASGLVLPSTAVDDGGREAILAAIDDLRGGGSTNGEAGINLAYRVASDHFIEGGLNRVILCTDGDFNVGASGEDALRQLIEQKRDSGVYLNVMGFGMGRGGDAAMESLSNHGNGIAASIDGLEEAERVFVRGVTGQLVPIASDVKLQIDFNPANVAAYRLIGYANRRLADQDFADDRVDAGDMGAGHSVTALYEIVPVGVRVPRTVEPSKYARGDDADGPIAGGGGGGGGGSPSGEAITGGREDADDATASRAGRAVEDRVDSDAAAGPEAGMAAESRQATEPAAAAAAGVIGNVGDELLTVRLRYKRPGENESIRFDTPAPAIALPVSETSPDFRHAVSVAGFGMLLRDSRYAGAADWDMLLDLAGQAAAERDPDGDRAAFVRLIEAAQRIDRFVTPEPGAGAAGGEGSEGGD